MLADFGGNPGGADEVSFVPVEQPEPARIPDFLTVRPGCSGFELESFPGLQHLLGALSYLVPALGWDEVVDAFSQDVFERLA